MIISHYQNARENHNVLIAKKSFEDMARFKYLETAVTKIAFTKKRLPD
jgi:hypothetical protein